MSLGPKAAPKNPKSGLKVTPNLNFGPPYLRPWGGRGVANIVVGWGGPGKVMTIVWAHLLISVRCGRITYKLQSMLTI